MARTGRPTKYTPEVVAKILATLRLGSYPEIAALSADIDETTYYRWIQKYPDFCQSVKKAIAQAETRLLVDIEEHPDAWQRQAWKLERRFGDRWGRRDAVKVSGDADAPLKVIVEYADKQPTSTDPAGD